MDLEDALTLGNLGAGVTPRVAILPYLPPPLGETGWRFATGYTVPAGDATDFALEGGSILVYQWAWYDDLPFALSTGYTAPGGAASDIAMEAR